MAISDLLRQTVVGRADNRCEYCLISQSAQEGRFHIDHIIPQSAAGPTTMENLALACVTCSLRKTARKTARDAETSWDVPIFNPRLDRWHDHFSLDGVKILGTTPTGRATAEALQFNRRHALDIRTEEQLRGRFPPV